jgi:hypothetical protein
MHARIDSTRTVVEYPILNIRQYFPELMLPEDLTNDATLPDGFVYVHASVLPTLDKMSQKAEQALPVYDGTKWVVSYVIVPLSPDELGQVNENAKATIASRRFTAEVSGITFNGMTIYTDRTTQSKLTGAAVRAIQNSAYTVSWKLADNTFITLTSVQILAVADAVGDYVQACYNREAALLVALGDGTYADAMLEEGWPV